MARSRSRGSGHFRIGAPHRFLSRWQIHPLAGTFGVSEAREDPKGEIHAQLDLWSFDKARGSIVLRQFDTLGFVTTYILDKAGSGPDRWVLIAESLENVPKGWKARYVFTRKSDDEYHEMLELDPDGKGFQPYVTNRFLRVTLRTARAP